MAEMTLLSERALAASCDAYLAERTATFEQRCERYSAAYDVMAGEGGLGDGDILLDLGAGGTDLDAYLRIMHGWRGRYWPVDGWMGIDITDWEPARPVEWVACLEVIEHLPYETAMAKLAAMREWATKGVVLSTPNAATVDVLAIDRTHLWGCDYDVLAGAGFHVAVTSLYGKPDDSLLAWWAP